MKVSVEEVEQNSVCPLVLFLDLWILKITPITQAVSSASIPQHHRIPRKKEFVTYSGTHLAAMNPCT